MRSLIAWCFGLFFSLWVFPFFVIEHDNSDLMPRAESMSALICISYRLFVYKICFAFEAR